MLPSPSVLRVLLVDDHDVVRSGLAALLARRPRFAVVAEAATGAEALDQARRHVPDIVLMDLRLPDGSGVSACRAIREEFPDMAVVFLTSSPDEVDVYAAVLAGARGYVLKQTPTAELIRALEAVGRGESLLDPSVTQGILERLRRLSGQPAGVALKPREREILRLLAEGMSNREIAEAVFLSPKTVKNYVSSIFEKLGMDRRIQAIDYVSQNENELR